MKRARRLLAFGIGAGLAWGAVPPASAQESPPGMVPLVIPVYDSDTPVGTISAEVGTDGNFRVSAQSLLAILGRIYGPAEFTKVSDSLTGVEYVTREDLARLQLPVRFDPQRVALVVSVPVDVRARTVLQFGGIDSAPPATASRREPEDLSGYLNVNLGFIDDPQVGVGRTRGEVFLDGAVRVGDYVLENAAVLEFGGPNDRFLSRRGTRLTRDFPAKLLRVSAGDIISSSVGFIGSVDLLGVSAFRNVEVFEPFRSTRPTGRQSFVLTEPANVDIYINGSLARQERLPPGNYDLANFQLVDGANDVRVEVVNDRGESQTFTFTSFFNSQLLAEGIAQWEINAGVRAQRFDLSLEYDFDKPVFAGFYRRGMSNRLTLGANFKLEAEQAIAGGEAVMALPYANVSLDAAASITGSRWGGAVAVTARPHLPPAWETSGRAIDGFLEYTTARFGDNAFTGRGGGLRTGVRYTDILIPERLSFTANLGYNSTFAGRGGFEASSSFAYRFDNDLIARLTADYREASAFGEAFAVRISISKQFGRRGRANASYDTRRNRYTASYDYRSQYGGIGTVAANVSTSGSDTQQRIADSFVSYTGNRFDATAGYTHVFDEGRSGELGSVRANIATSIAFAGGEVAIGRPVRDSFAIVRGHDSLDGRQIIVGPGNQIQGDLARSGALGPALLSSVNSYSLGRYPFDVVDLPPGYDIGTGILEVFPPYRSGYSVEVGSDRRASLIGYLIDPAGSRLGFTVGTASSSTDSEFGDQQVFTNRQGRFALTGLIPGNEYRIVFPDSGTTAVLRVPEDAEGFVDLGEVMVEEAR